MRCSAQWAWEEAACVRIGTLISVQFVLWSRSVVLLFAVNAIFVDLVSFFVACSVLHIPLIADTRSRLADPL